MDYGYILLQKKILDWEWYKDTNTKSLFIHLLLRANWKDSKWRGIDVKRGQLITSVSHLSDELNLSERSIRTALEHLTRSGEIDKQSTSKYSVITVLNYDKYQTSDKQNVDKKTDKKTSTKTGDRQTTDKQATTTIINKNNINNINTKNNNTPLPPTGEDWEWDFSEHTNVQNASYLIGNNIYSDTEYIQEQGLWEIIKDWMEYKDAKKPQTNNHYVNTRSISTLLNEFVRNCKEHGAEWVIDSVNYSMSRTWMGIQWGEGVSNRQNNKKSQIDKWSEA